MELIQGSYTDPSEHKTPITVAVDSLGNIKASGVVSYGANPGDKADLSGGPIAYVGGGFFGGAEAVAANSRAVLWGVSYTTEAMEPVRTDGNGLAVNVRGYDIESGALLGVSSGLYAGYIDTTVFYGLCTLSVGMGYSAKTAQLVSKQFDSSTFTQANYSVTTASQTVAAAPAANQRRTGLIVSNSSINIIHVDLTGGTASATNGIHIEPGAMLQLSEKQCPQGAITAYAAAVGSQVCVFQSFDTEGV